MIVKVVELWCNKPGCKASFQSRCLTGIGARAEAVKAGWVHVLTRVTRSGPALSEDFCPTHKVPDEPTVQADSD
jgi:hypothetical protein